MPVPPMRCFEFGPFRLDERKRLLTNNGSPVEIRPKVFDVLLELVSHSGRVLSIEQLYEYVWGKNVVENANIPRTIFEARLALNDERKNYIQNIPGKGYIFSLEVRECSDYQVGEKNAVSEVSLKVDVVGADPMSSPYVGPRPFPEDRAADFFGRAKEVEDLVKLLSDPTKPVVLLYSASGAGKTSLISTRLKAALLKQGHQVLPTARVGVPAESDPTGANPYTNKALASMEEDTQARDAVGTRSWKRLLPEPKPGSNTIVMLDQLEELVTTRVGSPAHKEGFFFELREVLGLNPSLRLILAFREEYLAEVQRIAHGLAELWTPYQLSLLTRDDATEAISKPALRQGVNFEPAVLSELVNRLATVYYLDVNGQPCEDPGRFVEPLHLQLLCDALWKNLLPGQHTISLDDLRQATQSNEGCSYKTRSRGTVSRFVESVLHAFCEDAISNTVTEFEANARRYFPPELVDLGCLQFITESGRHPILQQREWTGNLPNKIVDGLASRQLLRIEQRLGKRWFELAHDTLIKPLIERAERIDDEALYDVFMSAIGKVVSQQSELNETEVAQEFYLLFVSEDGSALRPSADTLKNAANRIPSSILAGLASRGILRPIKDLESTVYEFSNERLARAIYLKRSPAMDDLHRTREMLEGYLEKHRRSGGSTEVWYEISGSTLEDLQAIERFIGIEKLSPLEARFVLRASLASGYRPKDLEVLALRHGGIVLEVLKEATQLTDKANVRANVAYFLGRFDFDNRETLLLNLALEDPDQSVQIEAAKSLAYCHGSTTWTQLFDLLNSPDKRSQAFTVLAWIHDALPNNKMTGFLNDRNQTSLWTRIRLRARLSSIRARNSQTNILTAAFVAVMITMLFTAPARALLATFDLTTTQRSRLGLLEGALNGALGVLPWAIFIGGGLLCWWFIAEGRRPWRGTLSPVIGALGGLLGGLINTLEMVFVYGADNLASMHWIPRTGGVSTLSGLTQTGAIFIMPLFGVFVGLGVGLESQRMLRQRRLSSTTQKPAYRKRSMFQIISLQAILKSWLILTPMLAVAMALYSIMSRAAAETVAPMKLFGEAICIYVGGLSLVIGLFFGLHLLTKGLHIPSREG